MPLQIPPEQLGLYIHVPFCVRKCAYCDFYSVPSQPVLVESYIDAMIVESKAYGRMSFDTMYLGGGTPSILGADNLTRLVGGLRNSFNLSHVEEATIEALARSGVVDNASSLAQSDSSNASSSGVNRASDIGLPPCKSGSVIGSSPYPVAFAATWLNGPVRFLPRRTCRWSIRGVRRGLARGIDRC